MKFIKLAAVLVLLMVMAGCGTAAKESDFMKHDTMYKNSDHMKFSWFGYRTPTTDDAKKSAEQTWWGDEIPVENVK